MRLITKTHDYYDSLQRLGGDPTHIYNRTPKIVSDCTWSNFGPVAYEFTQKFLTPNYQRDKQYTQKIGMPYLRGRDTLQFCIVGFCGRFYYVLHYRDMNHEVKCQRTGKIHTISVCKTYYSHQEALDCPYLLSLCGKKILKGHNQFMWLGEVFPYSQNRDQIFIDLKAPTFVWLRDDHWSIGDGRVFCTNYPLSYDIIKSGASDTPSMPSSRPDNLEFVKVVDPYTAWQELSMYVGNVLSNNEPDMASISDISMRDKKGFDRLSFKTPPTKKR